MSPEMLGFALLGGLFVLILVGFPITFTLIFVTIIAGFAGIGDNVFNMMVVQFDTTMETGTLAAVPLFIFMGHLLERAGLMERLFEAFRMMFAPVPGSLYLAVLMTAAVFAMATGIVAASVTIIGLMAGRLMQKSGYDVRMSAGAITAGGTLGILIPPSIMLIVMGPILRVSILQLFAAAVMPGLLLTGLFLGYCLIRSFFSPRLGPPLPVEERAPSVLHVVKEFFLGILPLSAIIAATLGSILAGVATPTEAAAMGALGAFCLSVAYGRMSWEDFSAAMLQTLQTSSMVLFLIAACNFFGAVFSILGTPFLISDALIGLGLPPTAILLLLMALIFFLGWALDWAPIVLIFLPIMVPIVTELNMNLVWFGTLVAVCLQTAWLSPPVALSAYFLKGVMPQWELKDIYIGMVQFMVLQLIAVVLVTLFPQIALWLPEMLTGK